MIELEKEKKKITSKYRWETIDAIPLLPLIGVKHRQPIVHMYKRLVYLYTTDKQVNQFAVGFMINPSLHVKRVFR